MDTGTSVHAAACGENHLLLLDVDGCVFTCGSNEKGALGAGHDASVTRTKPARLMELLKRGVVVSDVYACGASSAAVSNRDGGRALYTWGANGDGQLGLGDCEDRPTPCAVEVGGPVVDVGLGDAHMHVLYERGEEAAGGGAGGGAGGNERKD